MISLLLKFVWNSINQTIFKILNNFYHFCRISFVYNDILKEPFYESTHKFLDFPFHCPLLIDNPLFVSFVGLLFLFKLLKLRGIKFVNIFEFLFKIFVLLIHFSDWGTCNFQLICQSTILRLFASDEISKSFNLISKFLYLLGFKSKELESVFLKFLNFVFKYFFHRGLL